MRDKCALCNGSLKNKLVDYNVHEKSIGKFPALVCDLCGEQWFNEEIAKKIENKFCVLVK